jgi:hypothetical protein
VSTLRPSEELDRLRKEVADLEAYCALLKGVIEASGRPVPDRRRTFRLAKRTPQEMSVIGVLLEAWPDAVDRYDILVRLPTRSDSADPLDRQIGLVSVVVARLRASLGADAIETLNRHAYRLSDAFHADLAGRPDSSYLPEGPMCGTPLAPVQVSPPPGECERTPIFEEHGPRAPDSAPPTCTS